MINNKTQKVPFMIQKIEALNELYDIQGGEGGRENGAEKSLNNHTRPTDGKQNDLLAGGGEMGGSDAVTNDAARFVDWINGNGAYGVAGRDFMYSMTSMAIVNPVAAGIILGSMAAMSAIHGMATSSWARFNRAQRRLKRINKDVISDKGYRTSTWWRNMWSGVTSLTGQSEDNYNDGLGPIPFVNNLKKDINDAITAIDDAGLVTDHKNGVETGKHKEVSKYTDAGSRNKSATIMNTVMTTLYLPERYISDEKKFAEGMRGALVKRAEKSNGGDTDALTKAAKKSMDITPFTPIQMRAEEEVQQIRTLGEDICKEYERLMAYSLKGGSPGVRERVNKLNMFWKKCMQNIEKKYRLEIDKLQSSSEMTELAGKANAVSKVEETLVDFSSYQATVSPGELFSGQLSAGLRKHRTYEVMSVDKWGGNAVELFVCNSNGTIVNTTVDELFDRGHRMQHFVPKKGGSSSVTLGTSATNSADAGTSFFKINLPAGSTYAGGGRGAGSGMDETYLVQAYAGDLSSVPGAVFGGSGAAPTGATKVVFYSFVNLSTTGLVHPTMFWMPANEFNPMIVVGGYISEKDSHVGESKKTAESFDTTFNNPLFEDGENQQQNNTQQSQQGQSTNQSQQSTGSKTKKVKDNPTKYSDATGNKGGESLTNPTDEQIDEALKKAAFVPAAMYRIRSNTKGSSSTGEKGRKIKDRIVETGEILRGKVKFYLPANEGKYKDEQVVSIDEWNKMDPIQVWYKPGLGDDNIKPEPGPDDNDKNLGDVYRIIIETGYPLSYRTFSNVYMFATENYDAFIKQYYDELSAYALSIGSDGTISGLVDVSEQENPSLYCISNHDMFVRYINFLGKDILFKDEAEFKSFLEMENGSEPEEEIGESVSYIIDGFFVLNESVNEAVNEAKDKDGIDVKTGKKVLATKSNAGVLNGFAKYYQQKMYKYIPFSNNDAYKDKYEKEGETYNKLLKTLDRKFFVEYIMTMCGAIKNKKVGEMFEKTGKRADYNDMLRKLSALAEKINDEKKYTQVVSYHDIEGDFKDPKMFGRADGKDVPDFDKAITEFKEIIKPYTDMVAKVPEKYKEALKQQTKKDAEATDKKVDSAMHDSISKTVAPVAGSTTSTTDVKVDDAGNDTKEPETNTDDTQDTPVAEHTDFTKDIEEIKKVIEELTKEEESGDTIDVPNIVKKVCAMIKHKMDEVASQLIKSFDKTVKTHMAKGGYVVPTEEFDKARANEYASEWKSEEGDETPDKKYFNTMGNGWTVIEIMEDHIGKKDKKNAENAENKEEVYHVRYAESGVAFKPEWLNDISRVVPVPPFNSKDGDAIWASMQANTGLKCGRTYKTSKEVFKEIVEGPTQESLVDMFFKEMALNEDETESGTESTQSDDSVIFMVDEVLESEGKFRVILSDKSDAHIIYNKVAEKTFKDGKFIGTDMFELYRVQLKEGATYKIEDKEYFDELFGEDIEDDNNSQNYMNNIRIEKNDAFRSTVAFALAKKTGIEKPYYEIDESKFEKSEDKTEDNAKWWEEGHKYEIDQKYFVENFGVEDKVDESKPVVITVGKETDETVSVTLKESGKSYDIQVSVMSAVPEDKRRDVSVRPIFGEGGLIQSPDITAIPKESWSALKKISEGQYEEVENKIKAVLGDKNNVNLFKDIADAFVGLNVDQADETNVATLASYVSAFIGKIVDVNNQLEEGKTYVVFIPNEKNPASPISKECLIEHKSTSSEDPNILKFDDESYSLPNNMSHRLLFVDSSKKANESVVYGKCVGMDIASLRLSALYKTPLCESIIVDGAKPNKVFGLIQLLVNLGKLLGSAQQKPSDEQNKNDQNKQDQEQGGQATQQAQNGQQNQQQEQPKQNQQQPAQQQGGQQGNVTSTQAPEFSKPTIAA